MSTLNAPMPPLPSQKADAIATQPTDLSRGDHKIEAVMANVAASSEKLMERMVGDLAAAVAEVESAQADTRRWRGLLTSARLEALEVQKDHTIALALFLSTQNAIGTLAVQLESRAERLSPGDSGHGVELLEIAKSLRAIVTDRAAISAKVLR